MSNDALALSMPLFDLRPPKQLTRDERKYTPISFAVGPDGKVIPVSFLADHVWHFDAYITADNIPNSMKKIIWRIKLPDGYLTDPKHAALLEASQDFIWSLFADPEDGKKRKNHSTLRTRVMELAPLLRWMVANGFKRFADIEGHAMNYLPAARKNEQRKGTVEDMTVATRLMILEQLYHQRDKLHDYLPRHPWPHESAGSLAGVLKSWALKKNKTEALPDAIADELGMKALEYVQNHALRILEHFEKMTAAGDESRREVVGSDLSSGTKRQRVVESRSASAREAGFDGSEALRAEMIRLRTACYIVIDIFSGVRDSELLGISKDCIAHRRTKDDTMDTCWLHGEIIKGGRRPKAWQVTESVELAVKVIARLTAPLSTLLSIELDELKRRIPVSIATDKAKLVARYNQVKRQRNKLFLAIAPNKGNQVSVISSGSMNLCLKSFCADMKIRDEDGELLSLKSSDFRPTYARMVARNELGDILTLRDHLGHRSVATTIGYCGDASDSWEVDTELMQMVVVAKQERQEEIMGNLLSDDKPLANGGHFLNAWRDVVRTAKNKEELIAQFSGALTLNGTGHSWCVGAANSRSCGGFCVMEAKQCPECYYGIISEEHRPVWQGILEQQEEALALGDLGIPGIARAKEIRDVAIKVLNRLDGKSDPAQIRFGEFSKPKVVSNLPSSR